MAKRASGDPSDKLAAYRELVAAHPAVELKGATMPYTSVNGHMFSFLARDGTLALRLPSGEREAFITRHKSKLAEQYGAVMKEYIVVPDALLARPADLKR